jgi:hypothetical protein
MNAPFWDSHEVQISFTRHSAHVAIELTLRSDPNVKLVLYELSDGLHIAHGSWRSDSKNTIIPRGQSPTDKNLGFVEACVNPTLRAKMKACPGLTFDQIRNHGASLARKGKLSPETLEVFQFHVSSHQGLLKQIERRRKIEAMKQLIKELGDMEEQEMLEIWREACAEKVMES